MKEKIGVVVQRYGLEINGGAEYHARLIAEKLAKYFQVEVFTTRALDYITWQDHFPEGTRNINNIPVHRFSVSQPRDPKRFGEIQKKVFHLEHTFEDELLWLREEGPLVPSLIQELKRVESGFSFFLFFSYRYYHSYYGVESFPAKAVLVPTAEHDEVIYLKLFKPLFHRPAAIVYNSPEERAMIHRITANQEVYGETVGVGSEIPESFKTEETRRRYQIPAPYCLYIGRLDENKGVPHLFDYYMHFLSETRTPLTLVLVGRSHLPIPDHPRIRHLGFLPDQEKFDLLNGCDFLLIPSQFESLSMVCLEAWALGKPVVVNGRTPVLKGQCRRSQAGLWYETYEEFQEVISLLASDTSLRMQMGKNGENYFRDHYRWEVIEEKYLRLLDHIRPKAAENSRAYSI